MAMSSPGAKKGAEVIDLVDTEDETPMSADEMRYLSSSRLATHFMGEDLCDRADIERRNRVNRSTEPTIPLESYNEGFVDMMVNRDHKKGRNLSEDMTDYEVESMVESILNLKVESDHSSGGNGSDNDIEEIDGMDEEASKKWKPNVFLPPKQDLSEFLDIGYKLDFDEPSDTCVNYAPIQAPKGYLSCQKAYGFDRWFLARLKRLDCRDVRLELHLWPTILKGFSVCCVSRPKSGKTNAFLIPLMYELDKPAAHMDSRFSTGSERTSIGAIVMCSSTRQTYEIAQQAKRWRDIDVSAGRQTVRIVSLNSSNADKQYISLMNGCDILVSTPKPLLKAIQDEIIDVSSTQYLIIDEADVCLKVHVNAIKDIYIAFAKSKGQMRLSKDGKGMGDNLMAFQTMAFARKWTQGVEWFAKEIQHMPVVTFGSYYELSIAFKIECNLEVITADGNREDTVLRVIQKAIDSNKSRIAVVCRTIDEIKFLKRRLMTKWTCVVVTHETKHYDLEQLCNKWRTGTVLLVNDSAIRQISSGFKKCQCLIHYKLPNDFKETFGDRFRLMRGWLKKYETPIGATNARRLSQYILIGDDDSGHEPQLIRYLKRLKARVPLQLTHVYDSQQRLRPLCGYYSSYGKCPFESLDCPKRHAFGRHDRPDPRLPTSGQIKITVTYVLGANDFYFRCHEFRGASQTSGKWQPMSDNYDAIREELIALKDTPYNTVRDPTGDRLYGIAVRGQVFRVRLTKIIGSEETNFYEDCEQSSGAPVGQKVELFTVDFGHKLRSNSRQLFELPDHLQDVPALALRGHLFGIKPIANEIEWDFRSTQAFYELVDNYRISEVTAWVVKQVNGVFWLNRLHVQKRLKNARLNVGSDVSECLIRQKFVDENELKLANVNQDYNRIVNIWSNYRLNSVAYGTSLVDEDTYVVVSDWTSIDEFYVTRENQVKRLQDMEDKWMQELPTLKPLLEVTDQQICFYKLLDTVYDELSLNRARVVAINGDAVDLFLVDHGQRIQNVPKKSLYTIQDVHLKALPFQAMRVALFGVKPVKDITYDLICELTRNAEDQYVMCIARKVNSEVSDNVIRLFVATNKHETRFHALSKLLVDMNACEYIDGEEDDEWELMIEKTFGGEEDGEEESDYLQAIEAEMENNLCQDVWLQLMDLHEDLDIDDGSAGDDMPRNESRIQKKLRQLRAIRRMKALEEAVDEEEEDDSRDVPFNGFGDIDFSDYRSVDTTGISCYDPEDDSDDHSLHSDEDGLIDEDELS